MKVEKTHTIKTTKSRLSPDMDSPRKYSSPYLKNILSKIDKKEHNRTESRMGLSARIGIRIKELQISKLQFSQILHVQPSMVTRWLSGNHNFTSDTLTDIQSVLGISLLNTTIKY